jgi:hypothetical protein
MSKPQTGVKLTAKVFTFLPPMVCVCMCVCTCVYKAAQTKEFYQTVDNTTFVTVMCVCVRARVCVFVNVCMHIHACMHTYVHVCVHVCTCVRVCV